MTSPTTIKTVHFTPLDLELTEPFGISGGTHNKAKNVLVTITLKDGTVGLGEGAPLPAYNNETQEMVLEAVKSVIPELIGKDLKHWRELCHLIGQQISYSGSAVCALESAILDAFCRHQRKPLWTLFGDARSTIETDMTVTTQAQSSEEEAVLHAKNSAQSILERGIFSIKTKVGLGIDIDIKRLCAIRSIAPHSPLILDANGAFTSDEALSFLEELSKKKIIPLLFEQPVKPDDIAGLKHVKENTEVKVIADESVKDVASARKVIESGAADGINLKIMKKGILEAVAIAQMADENNIALMIGGNVESILAMTISACISYGLGTILYHDLDTPAWIVENPFEGGFMQNGAMITVDHITSGHGVSLLLER